MRRGAVLVGVFSSVAVLLAPTAAEARPRLGHVVDLTGSPQRIARGPDGNIWVTLDDPTDPLARIKPNGNVTEYDPVAVVNPIGITAGPDGNLWLTRNGGVIRVPPSNPNNAQDFAVTGITAPQGITKTHGLLWTGSTDQLVSFPPSDPTGMSTSKTINGMSAREIAASGGRLWIADFSGRIVSVSASPPGGTKLYNVSGGPQGVSGGPHKTIAFSQPTDTPQYVARLTQGEKPRKTTLQAGTDPFGIVFAPDKKWWFAEFGKNQLGVLSQTGKVTAFKHLPNNSGPRYLTVGPNHTLWVALQTTNQVAEIKGL